MSSHFVASASCLGEVGRIMREHGHAGKVVQWVSPKTTTNNILYGGSTEPPEGIEFMESIDISVCFENAVQTFLTNFEVAIDRIAVYPQSDHTRSLIRGIYQDSSVRFVVINNSATDSTFSDNRVEIQTETHGLMNAMEGFFDERFQAWLESSTFAGQLTSALDQLKD